MREQTSNWADLFIGIIIMLSSIALLIWKDLLVVRLFKLTGILIILYGVIRLISIVFSMIDLESWKDVLFHTIIAMALIPFGIAIYQNINMNVRILSMIIGGYQILIGLANTISYFILRNDGITNRFFRLVYGIFHVLLGLLTVSLRLTNPQILNLLAVYTFFIGLTYLNDGRRVLITEEQSRNIKRKFRIPVPIIFQVLLPVRFIQKLNQFIEDELDFDTSTMRSQELQNSNQAILQVQISASPNDIDIIGHSNIVYNGIVYSYGNHDVDSRHLFGSIGDGVMAVGEKESYLDLSLKRGNTIIEYDIVLTEDQRKTLEAKLQRLMTMTYPYIPQTETQKESYGGQLVEETNTKLFKFKKSRYKTYFVFGTNCVLLTDDIIGISGLDLFPIVGVLTPGTYYDYLEKEYQRDKSIVINRRIYNNKLFNYIGLHKINN